MAKRSGKRQKKAAPVASGSKRKEVNEFLGRILDSLKRDDGLQEAGELVAELKVRTGSYLSALVRRIQEVSAAERHDLLHLIAHLEDPDAVPFLEKLIFEATIDVAAKKRSAEILEQMGHPLEVGMAESLNHAESILLGIANVKFETFHGSSPLFIRFVQLPPSLRQATLLEMVRSAPEMSLKFIDLMQSRENRPPPETIEALVALGSPKAKRILEDYADGDLDRETARLVRRALYRLESQGIQSEGSMELEKPGGSKIFRPLVNPPQGFMSTVDRDGSRVVWLAKPIPGGGCLLFQAIVNDEQGLLDFSALEVKLRSFRSYVREITQGGREFPVAEIPASEAAELIHSAYELSSDRRMEIPQEYPLHQRQVAEMGEGAEGVTDRLVNEAAKMSAEAVSPERMKGLLDQPVFSAWGFGKKEVTSYVDDMKEMLNSQLVVSKSARQEQFDKVCKKATTELFQSERLERFKKRLEASASVLLKTNQEESARLVLAVSESLGNLEEDPAEHPFLYELVFRSLVAEVSKELPMEGSLSRREEQKTAADEEPEEPSLIITPGETRKSAVEGRSRSPSEAEGGSRIITPG